MCGLLKGLVLFSVILFQCPLWCLSFSSGFLPSRIIQGSNSISRSHGNSAQRQKRGLLFGPSLPCDSSKREESFPGSLPTDFLHVFLAWGGQRHNCPRPVEATLEPSLEPASIGTHMEEREKLNKIWVSLKNENGWRKHML